MTCKTCNDDHRPEDCGVNKVGEECPCCGMTLIAVADESENLPESDENHEVA